MFHSFKKKYHKTKIYRKQNSQLKLTAGNHGRGQSKKIPIIIINIKSGGAGHRSRYLSHAKRALYHLSYAPVSVS